MDGDNKSIQKTKPRQSSGLLRTTFENPWHSWNGLPSIPGLIQWKWQGLFRSTVGPDALEEHIPVMKPRFPSANDNGVYATWLGHSTVVAQIDGLTVLTDPILSDTCSPISTHLLGHKRYRPSPCSWNDVPPIDIIVISHNHYDHLDSDAVNQLNTRFGDRLHWYVPLGLLHWFQSSGVQNVVEMNWWEEQAFNPALNQDMAYKIVCLPCQHWSVRRGWDKNTTLWASWAIIAPNHRFYFAGDTGYCPEAFKSIGHYFGPFDLAAIPIGCYEPREFMRQQHVNPEEAVCIHKDVKARYSLGIHWGTYDMGAAESHIQPKFDLEDKRRELGLESGEFFTLGHGETWQLPHNVEFRISAPSDSLPIALGLSAFPSSGDSTDELSVPQSSNNASAPTAKLYVNGVGNKNPAQLLILKEDETTQNGNSLVSSTVTDQQDGILKKLILMK